MKAGPRNGRTARSPRRWPVSERSAAARTRSSPGRASSAPSTCQSAVETAAFTALTATFTNLFDEDRAGQAQRNAEPAAFDPNGDRTFELAGSHDVDASPGNQGAALELAEHDRVVVGDPLDDQFLPHPAVAQSALAQGPDLALEAGYGVPVGVELGPAQQVKDALLHPLGDEVLQTLSFLVNLVPAVAKHLDEEHLQQPVMPHELQR